MAMQQMFAPVQQQIVALVCFSVPFIALYHWYPALLLSLEGTLLCVGVVGLCVACLGYGFAKLETKFLHDKIPCGACRDSLEKTIRSCGFDPRQINLCFDYEATATVSFNTIFINPLLWGDVEHDSSGELLAGYCVPRLSLEQKNYIAKIRDIFSSSAQNFVVRHELGHVIYWYSYKAVFLSWVVSSIALFVG